MRRAPDETCQSHGKRPVSANRSGSSGDPELELREARLFLFGEFMQNVTDGRYRRGFFSLSALWRIGGFH